MTDFFANFVDRLTDNAPRLRPVVSSLYAAERSPNPARALSSLAPGSKPEHDARGGPSVSADQPVVVPQPDRTPKQSDELPEQASSVVPPPRGGRPQRVDQPQSKAGDRPDADNRPQRAGRPPQLAATDSSRTTAAARLVTTGETGPLLLPQAAVAGATKSAVTDHTAAVRTAAVRTAAGRSEPPALPQSAPAADPVATAVTGRRSAEPPLLMPVAEQHPERSLTGRVDDPRPARVGSVASTGSADTGGQGVEGRLAVRPPSSPAEQAPVIEVTIGRIEVRAMRAPESRRPPARSAAAAPRLSLEEYLARVSR